MSDILDQLRAAFDGDDIPRKNIALRKAHAEIERLNEAELLRATEMAKLEQQIGQRDAEIQRLREQVASLQASAGYEASIAQVEIERLRAAGKD